MATLNIGGRRVTIDDGFRDMTPEQQQSVVEEITASMPREFPPPAPARDDVRAEGAAASAIPGDEGMSGGRLEAALVGARQGATFGFGDEINAGVRAAGDWIGGKLGMSEPTTYGDAYDERLAHERALLDQVREENPVTSTVGEIAGAAAMPVGAAATGGSLAAQAARGALAGGAGGAVYGFGGGEGGLGNRARGAAVGAATGAAVGAVAPYAVQGVKNALGARAARKAADEAISNAPSAAELRAASSGLYESVGKRGVTIKESAFTPLVDDIAVTTREMGIDPDLTPRSVAALRRLTDAAGEDITWKDLETLRRVTSIASTAVDPNDRRVAGAIVQKVDDFVLNLVDGDLTSGTAAGLSDDLKEARTLWQRMRGNERVTGAMEAAKDAASGYENGLRIEFRKLIKDRKFYSSLAKPEQDAIRQVVRGTTAGNILKRVSRLSFGSGAQTNFLGASVGSGAAASIGGALAGPAGAAVGAAATPLVGHMAGRAAERSTEAAALRAGGLIAAGRDAYANALANSAPPALTGLNNALAASRLPAAALATDYWNPPSPAR